MAKPVLSVRTLYMLAPANRPAPCFYGGCVPGTYPPAPFPPAPRVFLKRPENRAETRGSARRRRCGLRPAFCSRNPPGKAKPAWQAGSPSFVLEPAAMVVFTIPPPQGCQTDCEGLSVHRLEFGSGPEPHSVRFGDVCTALGGTVTAWDMRAEVHELCHTTGFPCEQQCGRRSSTALLRTPVQHLCGTFELWCHHFLSISVCGRC